MKMDGGSLKVEKFVERWMREYKREVIVKLIATWRNVLIDEDDEQDVGKPKAMVCKVIFIC